MWSWIRTSDFVFFVVNRHIKREIKKPSGQFLGLIMMSHWFGEIWIQIWDISLVLPHYLSCEESRLLVSWCAGDKCSMSGSDNVCGRSRRPDAKHRRWSSTCQVLDDRTIGRSGDAVCGLYRTQGDEEHEFLDWALKPRSTVCQWFDLKTIETVCQWLCLKTTKMVSLGLALKPVATISSDFVSKTVASGFPNWASKPAATVWWFGPQNHCDNFLLWASKPSGLRFFGCVTKPMGGWRRRGAFIKI
jgi:hypothetical protein